MTTLMLRRTYYGFEPADTWTAEDLQRVKIGSTCECSIKELRNPQFHAKFMALMRIGFRQFSDNVPYQEHNGEPVKPSFDRFRKDVTIAAGYYTHTFDLDGKLTLEAQSIAFDKMSQADFEKLYSKAMDVLLARLSGYTQSDIEAETENIARLL